MFKVYIYIQTEMDTDVSYLIIDVIVTNNFLFITAPYINTNPIFTLCS
jgi:hypothetical protein